MRARRKALAAPSARDWSFRHELKYYINQGEAALLENTLALTMDRDPYAGPDGSYFIRSLYFDDVASSALRQKLDDVGERKKFRIRTYNLKDDQISLECKEKKGQFIHKSAVRISRALCEQILSGDARGLLAVDAPVARLMFDGMTSRLLRPAVIVDYVRKPFVAEYQNVRITFDADLRTGVFSKDLFDPYLPTVSAMDKYDMILEVKFDEYLPDYYHKLIQTGSSLRSAVSKYVLCRRFE